MSPRLRAGRARNALFGNNIRELRIRREMTEDALGVEIGVNQKQISKYETGSTPFPLERLPELCLALRVGYSEVFRGFLDNAQATPEDEQPRELWASRTASRIAKLPIRHRQTVSRLIDELSAFDITTKR